MASPTGCFHLQNAVAGRSDLALGVAAVPELLGCELHATELMGRVSSDAELVRAEPGAPHLLRAHANLAQRGRSEPETLERLDREAGLPELPDT